jgi:hypothetical protein
MPVLPKSNLELIASGNDANGNKVARLKFFSAKTGFSIQTGGNLPNTSTALRGLKTEKDMKTLSASQLGQISTEICNYIKKYGTDLQKKSLKTY